MNIGDRTLKVKDSAHNGRYVSSILTDPIKRYASAVGGYNGEPPKLSLSGSIPDIGALESYYE